MVELSIGLIVASGPLGPCAKGPGERNHDQDADGGIDQTIAFGGRTDQEKNERQRAERRQIIHTGRRTSQWNRLGMNDLCLGLGIGVTEGNEKTGKPSSGGEETHEERVGEMITDTALPTEGERSDNTVHQRLGLAGKANDESSDQRKDRQTGEEPKRCSEHPRGKHDGLLGDVDGDPDQGIDGNHRVPIQGRGSDAIVLAGSELTTEGPEGH